MGDRRINFFYLISFVCTVILIAYIGLVFLPEVSVYAETQAIGTIIIMVIILLLIVAGIQLYLLLRPP